MLRELREADAPRVAELFAEAFGEARRLDAEEIRSWLDNDELQADWLRVLEVDGEVVGYGDIFVDADEIALDVAAPGHWEPFFDWVEQEGRERGSARVRAYFPEGHELGAIASARGYAIWRSSYTMEIEVPTAPQPRVPDGIALRAYRDADAETLRAALNEAFAEDPFWTGVTPSNFREFYLRARGFDPSLWLLAWAGADLAGFVLAYPERAGDATLGWVGTLGVRPGWRRRGLGEALLLSAFAALRGRGLSRIGLGVDAENVTGALRLYERAGMRAVRRADNWVRRP
ncbi:MAG: GNAT family N-acetyltransferase [Gemmatimonadaceae bacterium]